MRNRHLLMIVVLITGLLFTGCNRHKVYSRYEHVPISGWEKTDTIHFCIPPIKEGGTYMEELGLRINSSFPYQSLTLEITEDIHPSIIHLHQSLNCSLIDKNGEIKGNGISYFQYTFQVDTLQLNSNDSVHISVIHNMKREILPGVTDVGITLTRQ